MILNKDKDMINYKLIVMKLKLLNYKKYLKNKFQLILNIDFYIN